MSDNLQGAGIFDADRSDLVQRHFATPGSDFDAVQDAWVGTTGTDRRQVTTQCLDGLAHAVLGVFLDSVDHF
ncbi:hypothetical protein D3C81_1813640 [compost metagenome]